MQLVDRWLPWLGDLMQLGGPILGLILLIAFGMWSLLFERLYYLHWSFPKELAAARVLWQERADKTSWYAQQFRHRLTGNMAAQLNAHQSTIATMIKVCPLLGLLGTVIGMLEVFDALAATGSNNPRSMAAGVSKATVSTLAGMVVAIFGLLASIFTERRAVAERDRLPSHFPQTEGRSNA